MHYQSNVLQFYITLGSNRLIEHISHGICGNIVCSKLPSETKPQHVKDHSK